jgi:hypothetical protein
MRILALAPGSHVTRLGICGNAVPDATIPSSAFPLVPPGAAAASLMISAAECLSISSRDLKSCALIVAEPAENASRATRRSICRAALVLLGMTRVTFVAAPVAIGLAVRRDAVPHVIVDVGWASTRIIIRSCIVQVAEVGLRDVGDELARSCAATQERSKLHDADVLRSCSCFFRLGGVRATDWDESPHTIYGDVTDTSGQVLVPAEIRWKAPEVLFDQQDGKPNSGLRLTSGVARPLPLLSI